MGQQKAKMGEAYQAILSWSGSPCIHFGPLTATDRLEIGKTSLSR